MFVCFSYPPSAVSAVERGGGDELEHDNDECCGQKKLHTKLVQVGRVRHKKSVLGATVYLVFLCF